MSPKSTCRFPRRQGECLLPTDGPHEASHRPVADIRVGPEGIFVLVSLQRHASAGGAESPLLANGSPPRRVEHPIVRRNPAAPRRGRATHFPSRSRWSGGGWIHAGLGGRRGGGPASSGEPPPGTIGSHHRCAARLRPERAGISRGVPENSSPTCRWFIRQVTAPTNGPFKGCPRA
jgi:hypothetical protein